MILLIQITVAKSVIIVLQHIFSARGVISLQKQIFVFCTVYGVIIGFQKPVKPPA
jgi:hypothetical protein